MQYLNLYTFRSIYPYCQNQLKWTIHWPNVRSRSHQKPRVVLVLIECTFRARSLLSQPAQPRHAGQTSAFWFHGEIKHSFPVSYLHSLVVVACRKRMISWGKYCSWSPTVMVILVHRWEKTTLKGFWNAVQTFLCILEKKNETAKKIPYL